VAFFVAMRRLNGQRKRAPDAILDDGDLIERLMRRFYPQLIETAFDAANDVPGIDVLFNLDNPYVQDMIDILGHNVRRIAETTRADIQQVIGDAAAEGLSTDQTAARIRALGFTDSISRSTTIARSESASAYTGGSLAAYRQSGVVKETEWLDSGDSCDICQALAGTRAALGDEFAPGVIGPPMHPNCTCSLSPLVE
jgi:SPP1 gp7 family putative phage head morphogenesis protein